ncbi:unnamed protein product [Dibothriocephalus latus]|uniref:Fe2OG dioxygenase domain-containing protein n=1 Tax=Dibothriocephalus latus TaxID=60516 RepID=A0A3P7KVW7_DIBLA|nr:unnamed protein product [Dibothriocephalus latus]
MPDFIDADTEADLLRNIYSVPERRWQRLGNRRLQIWGGTPHVKGMIAEEIPKWLHSLMDRISDLGVFGPYRANHVLINEYKSGQGIMPHHDGSLYYPVVTTVNLGGHSVLDFYNPIEAEQSAALSDRYVGSALLMPRSLNMVGDLLYTHYLHGIEERQSDLLYTDAAGDSAPTQESKLEEVEAEEERDLTKHIFNLPSSPLPRLVNGSLTRENRISVTIRHVPNTRKVDLRRLE